ncbi:hypothetical protein VP01_1294g7 [Puccinia sorghi]|uniref:Retrotransposon Copia-like N-terminal domain-containing protein n=1 Tax=Puccinia sorghi TaxID=27349 RepID=A0A0L6VQ07_9BASI|nr:hypothetical protein VP01_1294g7 [Puccinia sorghi]
MAAIVSHKTKLLLTSENYMTWIIPMEAKLHKIRALDIVTGKIPPPLDEKQDDKSNYVKLNEDAYAEIVNCLDPEVLQYTQCNHDSRRSFQWIRCLADPQSKFSSINKFLSDIQSANQKLILAGIHLDDQVKTLFMLKKLPAKFFSFCDIIAMGFAAESFEKILKKLESYAIQNGLNNPESTTKTSRLIEQVTLLTQSKSSSSSSESSLPACSHCKKPGHRPIIAGHE